MLNGRVAEVLLVGCVLVSILVPLAPPTQSKEASGQCPRFKPVEPKSLSEQRSEAPDAKVLTVRDAATEDDPLVLELDFGLALWLLDGDPNDPESYFPVIEDTQFFNVQVESEQREVALNANLVWDGPQVQLNDLDDFLYDSRGRLVAAGLGGLGTCCPPNEPLEFVTTRAEKCDGFTLEVRAFRTLPMTTATLEIWLRGTRK